MEDGAAPFARWRSCSSQRLLFLRPSRVLIGPTSLEIANDEKRRGPQNRSHPSPAACAQRSDRRIQALAFVEGALGMGRARRLTQVPTRQCHGILEWASVSVSEASFPLRRMGADTFDMPLC